MLLLLLLWTGVESTVVVATLAALGFEGACRIDFFFDQTEVDGSEVVEGAALLPMEGEAVCA